jgi:glycosyltransferase involved in cell wall biosynthesis
MAVGGESPVDRASGGSDERHSGDAALSNSTSEAAVRVETAPEPTVSFVVPALNEGSYLPATLRSIARQVTDRPHEVIVVDGGSDDGTVAIARDHGARVVHQEGAGIGAGRHAGAVAARGEWLAFVDADTVLRDHYLETMLRFVTARDLAAASSKCRLRGPRRTAPMEWTLNYAFPRLDRPILPGFNLLVARREYFDTGGFPNVPNEDTAFSRRLGRTAPTAYCPRVLVESSGRRIAASGLTGTLAHYLWLDAGRLLRSLSDRRR